MALSTAEFIDDWLGDDDSDLPFASKAESCIVRREKERLFVVSVASDLTRSGYVRNECVTLGSVLESSSAASSVSSVRSPLNRLSIRHSTGETVLGIAVPEAYAAPPPPSSSTDGKSARYMYLITVVTNQRAVAVRRTYREITAFDAQLRHVCDAAFSPPSASAPHDPRTALAYASAALHASRLHTRAASAATAELRRAAAEQYLRACLFEAGPSSSSPTSSLSHDLLDMRESIRALLAVFALGAGSTLVVVPAGQPSSSPVSSSTSPLSPPADTVQAALSAVYEAWVAQQGEEEEEGGGDQADGSVDYASQSEGTRSSSALSLPAVEPAGVGNSEPTTLPNLVPMPAVEYGKEEQGEGTQEQFTGLDLDQFDCLMEHGWAVMSSDSTSPSACPALEGQSLCAAWSMLVWDGSSETARRVERVTRATWQLGDGRHSCIPWGLSRALLGSPCALCAGSQLTVVLAPSMGHGEQGRPPVVPSAAHLVYQMTVLSAPQGPACSLPSSLYQAPLSVGPTMTIAGQTTPVSDADLVRLAAVAGGSGKGAVSARSGGNRASARFPGRDTKVTAVPLPPPGPVVLSLSSPAAAVGPSTAAPSPVHAHAHGQTLEDMLNPKPKVGTRKLTPEEAQALFASKMAALGQPLGTPAATPKAAGGKASPPPGVPHHAAAAAGSSSGGFFSKLWK